MTTKKIWIITILFLAVLTGFRFLWLAYNSTTNQPLAINGVLDLRDWDNFSDHPLSLNGEWEFYANTFLMHNESAQLNQPSSSQSIKVPGNWAFNDEANGNRKFGFGSYRLKILIDPDKGSSYGLHISSMFSSSEVYMNQQLIGHSGQPAESKVSYTPLNIPYTIFFTLEDVSEIELVIHAANFDNIRSAGIVHSIKFGLETNVRSNLTFSKNMVWVACVAYTLHLLYGFVLYLIGNRDKRLIYYSLMTACIIFTTLWDGERLLLTWIPFSFEWSLKSMYLVMLLGGVLLYQLIKVNFPLSLRRRFSFIYELLCGIAVLSILLLPFSTSHALENVYIFLMFIPCLFTLVVMYKSAVKIDSDNIFLLLAAVAAINSMIWLVVFITLSMDVISYPFDLIIAMICFSAFWFKRFFRLSEESRQLANSLQQADKQKDDFLATIAHELSNPLNGIINISQSVSERAQDRLDNSSANDLQLLVKVGRRMSYILNDLLDIARLKENRISLNLTGVSVHGIASSVIDTLRFMTDGKPIQLVNRVPINFPLVYADENRLNQILFNLLHNAIKFSNNGEVSVQAHIVDGWASIAVIDTGIGIDKALLDTVFEKYERNLSDWDPLKGGFGLGLSICKQLVEMHGGTLDVHSIPNEGSVFTFTLQLLEDEAIDEVVVPQAEVSASIFEDSNAAVVQTSYYAEPIYNPDPNRIRLLAVDDDPVNLNVLRIIFSDGGYEIVTAINGIEALKLLENSQWDLIISDVIMPVMSGYELTTRIRERFSISELPVLLLTASNQNKDIEAGFLSGANDYITKPVNATELKARVRSLTNLKNSVNERLRMEAALLQAQIKPHFLINTFTALSALSWSDKDKMDELIQELTNYFRLGIDFRNTDEAVPLDRELKLIRSYLWIQKERFGDRLQFVWEIDDEVNIYIPPLTIQPLVDNALIHGLLKRDAGGEVRIRITDLGQSVEICVSDNGVGIDAETVAHILDRQRSKQSGIGLLNTHRRLMQFCGSGLTIASDIGSGTSVTFTIAKHYKI